ncbi:DUF2306 domain-containing protein [Cytobacillus firmus]|uniref:DUF2306 domain-containing protein n=1 Tax=Cytobacillus firmus TaxID=1399 RepID=UPI00157FE980|nr:DUF2306 domain-containing protein [Cytobacillus firmus]MBG9546196.1 membrane protein [Cytobacillus firmus]MBG9601271.1 membrane protein [Cytobacillus firmus]MBG9658004.1 membrane protein [Cytobacillus firmus]MDD9309865.1 DUF2306 domain-containing protein [Cytobacillus firmus]MED1907923.1 DUF2306 domain-containing protein [Cytobacillus firmus]
MEELFSFFRVAHIAAGFLALILFWLPLLTKKGGKIHNRSGWIYVWSMAVVAISAFYMGVYRVAFDDAADSGRISFSWFLIFISILSAVSALYGMRVLNHKKRKEGHRNPLDITAAVILGLAGCGISIYGIILTSPLLTYFPLIGPLLAGIQLKYWLKAPVKKMHWVYEHFGGMIACGISTVTAFTVFGAPRVLNIQSTSLVLWLLPTLVLVPVMIGFIIKYDRKYNRKPKPSAQEISK